MDIDNASDEAYLFNTPNDVFSFIDELVNYNTIDVSKWNVAELDYYTWSRTWTIMNFIGDIKSFFERRNGALHELNYQAKLIQAEDLY